MQGDRRGWVRSRRRGGRRQFGDVDEFQRAVADRDDVAGPQRPCPPDPRAVDEGAVGRVQVLERARAAIGDDNRVEAGHAHRIEHDVAVRRDTRLRPGARGSTRSAPPLAARMRSAGPGGNPSSAAAHSGSNDTAATAGGAEAETQPDAAGRRRQSFPPGIITVCDSRNAVRPARPATSRFSASVVSLVVTGRSASRNDVIVGNRSPGAFSRHCRITASVSGMATSSGSVGRMVRCAPRRSACCV